MLALAAACPRQPASKPAPPPAPQPPTHILQVWAEPSLIAPLADIAPVLKKHGLVLQITPKESGELARDAAAGKLGSPPEVYLFTGERALPALIKAKAVDEATARTFAGDRLVVAGRQGERWPSPTVFDLYRLRFKFFGVADSASALGEVCDEALKSDGAYKRIEQRIRRYPGQKELIAALIANEVQLAMVYASAVAQDPELGVSVVVGADLHTDIRYRAVAAAGKASAEGVGGLLRLLAEDAGIQQSLGGLGLLTRSGALEAVR